MESQDKVLLKGSCHCKKVSFEVLAPAKITIVKCNCSICHMKQNHNFIVNSSDFKLLAGQDCLTEYTFNTKVARHLFCSICGVQSFYYPRSNPDGVAVTVYCIQNLSEIKEIDYLNYDGQNWEEEFKKQEMNKFSEK